MSDDERARRMLRHLATDGREGRGNAVEGPEQMADPGTAPSPDVDDRRRSRTDGEEPRGDRRAPNDRSEPSRASGVGPEGQLDRDRQLVSAADEALGDVDAAADFLETRGTSGLEAAVRRLEVTNGPRARRGRIVLDAYGCLRRAAAGLHFRRDLRRPISDTGVAPDR